LPRIGRSTLPDVICYDEKRSLSFSLGLDGAKDHSLHQIHSEKRNSHQPFRSFTICRIYELKEQKCHYHSVHNLHIAGCRGSVALYGTCVGSRSRSHRHLCRTCSLFRKILVARHKMTTMPTLERHRTRSPEIRGRGCASCQPCRD
jgi:hypothetical protein